MKKNGKLTLIITIISLVAILAIATGVTYAVWKNTRAAQDVTDVDSDNWNPSLKYQVFAALDAEGKVMLGDPAIEAVSSLAFVGYTGLIEALNIPSEVSIAEGGKTYAKRVTAVRVLPEGGGGAALYQNAKKYTYTQNVGMRNDMVVSTLELPASVTYITAGAFSSMQKLEALTIHGTGAEAIAIGDYAFSNCTALKANKYFCGRPISGTLSKIFAGSLSAG